MSKYTTEVRFICEHEAGLEESAGANSVDSVIANSWNKIFTTNCTFFDNEYRSILCSKILKHYYLREIGAEVVGVWKLWMNTKLEEIMPYYNQLYRSALLEFDPFKDVNYQKAHSGNNSGSSSSTGSKNGSNSSTNSGSTTDTGTIGNIGSGTLGDTTSRTFDKGDRYSDTPQGTIANTDVVGNVYLTNVRLIDETESGSLSRTTSDSNTETRNLSGSYTGQESGQFSESDTTSTTVSGMDAYIDTITGKMNATPYSDLLQKFRDTFLNIDMLVIEEFEELFLGLW